MRINTLTIMALMGFGLSGCSLWTKSDKTDQSAQSEISLRSAPQQTFDFAGQSYEVEIFDAASQYAAGSQYSGYDVQLYDPSQYYYYGYNDKGLRPLTLINAPDPRNTAFVKLNGQSQAVDWQNCETRHRGYLSMSGAETRLNPEFEVCMRNKGYVLTTEARFPTSRALSAKSAGLRGGYRQSAVTSTNSAFYR